MIISDKNNRMIAAPLHASSRWTFKCFELVYPQHKAGDPPQYCLRESRVSVDAICMEQALLDGRGKVE